MRQSTILVLLFWMISLATTQFINELNRPEFLRPDVQFLKRSSLSNMMRLGKRDSKRGSLGNLMRLGR
ncbi:unnamed protein product [Cylicocyclus nassatus]|uniref:Uncharacterized protein n=1 Tax=Cylicocyclus nassatus TaxID=53992 RepID=A0AA36MB32_CYLNA|nr:unnamed protein product [Cylicocyclus nassatus]